MSLKALFYAYVLGGLTFLPLVIFAGIFYTIYTSVPVGDPDPAKLQKRELELQSQAEEADAPSTPASSVPTTTTSGTSSSPSEAVNDAPRPRRGWLTVRRTFEETPADGSYVEMMVRGFLDARSKDPRRSRPKDTWYAALKGTVLYLYEDEAMGECEAAIELGGHEVVVWPEGLPDGELYAKRNAICLRPKGAGAAVGDGAGAGAEGGKEVPSVTREMRLSGEGDVEELVEEKGGSARQMRRERERLLEQEKKRDEAREQAVDGSTPWFIFVRSAMEMEDWYIALVHASDNPANSPTLEPLQKVFRPEDLAHLVSTLDEQPDVIPMRWLNALLGRIFFSYYRTETLESYIIGRLMKKISKVKRPAFLTDINVREVSVGNRAPTLSKPMLKELTKEGDASLEVHIAYKGEIRVTVEATATINLGARFKTYVVKLVLALVVREIEGNLLVKIKRPPSSRIWYAFTQMPKIVMDVEPVVSDRQITWSMILSTIESKVKEVIYESVVLPNMDDISFFDSYQCQHRGGIWADASRHDRAPNTLDGRQPTTTDGGSAVSEPLVDPPKTDSMDPTLVLPRSHSAEEIEKTPTGPSPPDPTTLARATTVDATGATVVGTPATKRRPWFSSSQDEADDPAPPAQNATPTEERVSRGRTLQTDAFEDTHASSSSSSETRSASTQPVDDIGEEGQHLSASRPTRRSTSQHSRSASSRATSVSSSHRGDFSDDAAAESQMASYRSKSPAPSGSSPRQTLNSPSSFFQTLKSRAADKQAISNTAKEAMRKWGVNWTNFRRETMGSSGSGNGAATAEEVPDAGHGDQRRGDSSRTSSAARPSYAEVRAAVEERRERERAPGEGSSRSHSPASEPIAVPQSVNGNEDERAQSQGVSPGNIVAAVSPASSVGVAKSVDVGKGPRTRSPAPMERTESHSSSLHRSSSHAVGIAPDEEERLPVPIHTQPLTPKTMTIPGIHASHRGEVMSMGYVPPPPAVSQEPKKAPLQSVYRLWKNPGTAAPSEPARVSQTGFTGLDQDSAPPPPPSVEGDAESSLSLQPSRPVPPPLPPRANSTHALREISRPSDTDSVLRASAAAALQSIVSKDRVSMKRASLTPPASIPSSPGQDLDKRGDTPTSGRPGASDLAESPASMTPKASSSPPPPSPPPADVVGVGTNGNGRGPPPALPPRRVRTSA